MKRNALRNGHDLALHELIDVTEIEAAQRVAQRYAIAITPEMVDLIERENPADPIALQFVPNIQELITQPHEMADPIGDNQHSPLLGLVHRYPDRVLLKIIHTCPVYCRFCFRREMVGPNGDGTLSPAELTAALDYIRARPEIFEVILTGGDPFMISARRARKLTEALASIHHVKIIRWHTRVPMVDPTRVTAEFVQAIKSSTQTVYVGVHANHASEFTEGAKLALARLADAGIGLVSQSVLLRGVNDDAEVLAELMRAFVINRVKPYYLHHLDLAPGTSHFRVSISEGQALMKALRGRVSGLAQPTYVIDIPGGFGKSPIGPSYVQDEETITDYQGMEHRYPKNLR